MSTPVQRLGVAIVLLVIVEAGVAMADPAVPIALSDRIGAEIDRAERDAYGLFPDIDGFVSSRIFRVSAEKYRVDYTFSDGYDVENSSRTITAETFEQTQRHVQLAEAYLDARAGAGGGVEALVVYQMALRYAIEHRYDTTVSLLEELQRDYPAQFDSLGAGDIMASARQLAAGKAVLSEPQSLIDISGRTQAYIFAGYYGIWLSIAVPAAFEADQQEPYALSLLTIPAASILFTHAVMKGRNVTRADARMITSGGWLGTWQGLGWASLGESDSGAGRVLGSGIAGGLAGIGIAGIINSTSEITTGHADLIGSGVWWGGWFGLLGAGLASVDEGDDVLRSMLVGSDIVVLGAAFGARNTTISRRRVRFMNLGGILGTLAGTGVILLSQPDTDQAIAVTLAATSIAGAWIGLHASREEAAIKSSRAAPSRDGRWSIHPTIELRQVGGGDARRTPHVGIAGSF